MFYKTFQFQSRWWYSQCVTLCSNGANSRHICPHWELGFCLKHTRLISQLFGSICKRIVGLGLNFLISWHCFGSQCQNQKLVVVQKIQLKRLSASTGTSEIYQIQISHKDYVNVDCIRFQSHIQHYCWGALTARSWLMSKNLFQREAPGVLHTGADSVIHQGRLWETGTLRLTESRNGTQCQLSNVGKSLCKTNVKAQDEVTRGKSTYLKLRNAMILWSWGKTNHFWPRNSSLT